MSDVCPECGYDWLDGDVMSRTIERLEAEVERLKTNDELHLLQNHSEIKVLKSKNLELKDLALKAAEALDRPETRPWRYKWVADLSYQLREACKI